MKAKLIGLLVILIGLSGCASVKERWDNLDGYEKVALAVVVGAGVIASSQGDTTVKVGGNGCHKHGNPPSRWDCPEL